MNQVINLIQMKLKEKNNILVGISGISLSGKTSYAQALHQQLNNLNIKSSTVSISEKDGVLEKALKDLNPSKYVYENGYDVALYKEKISLLLTTFEVVIVEGLLLYKNTHDIAFDLKLYLDCTFTTSINRAQEEKKAMISDLYMWLQRQHFSIDNPKAKADFIIKQDAILEQDEMVYVDLKSDANSIKKMKWLYEPRVWTVEDDALYVETDPITDFWQRTHYGFRNDNAHMMYVELEEDFVVEAEMRFNPVHQFDQCGLVVRIDEDNWLKTSIEYELAHPPKLGAVVTNFGYSDWSTQELEEQVTRARFKLTREGQDYKIEVQIGDKPFRQLRICHLHHQTKNVMVGIYCCSPIDSGYQVWFEDIKIQQRYF
ncbi:MAG TPA: hypothetical protein DCY20_00360 [Firmicutes bacterium]|nr:hypothetical protein [Bacillota bacterium]